MDFPQSYSLKDIIVNFLRMNGWTNFRNIMRHLKKQYKGMIVMDYEIAEVLNNLVLNDEVYLYDNERSFHGNYFGLKPREPLE